jgi:hypothetical protein
MMYTRRMHTDISRSRPANYSHILRNLLVSLFAFQESLVHVHDTVITHRNRHAQRRKIKGTGSSVFTP